MLRSLLLYAGVTILAGCTSPEPRGAGAPDIYQRTHHQLTLPPQSAAACIGRNTKALGYTPDFTPLYGTEVMAVTAKTLPAGGIDVAAIQLLPHGAGSRAHVTITTEKMEDQPNVIRSLLAGC